MITRDRASPRMHGPPHTVHKDTVPPAIAGNDQAQGTGKGKGQARAKRQKGVSKR